MRTLQRFATVCFIGAAFAALISACGSTDAAPPGPSAGAPGAAGAHTAGSAGAGSAGAPTGAGGASAGAGTAGGGSALVGNAANGMTTYSGPAGCNFCHGAMGEGGIGPNITGSKPFGIGNWNQAQFHDAVRFAKDKSGAQLNTFMMPFAESAVSEQAIADMYAYLMSHSIETKNEGSTCAQAGACKGSH